MRAVRRLIQVAAIVGTLIVGVVAVALIVSQTPWFRDWLRRYVVRESKQYLNGELTIGRLGGNLFFGVDLTDVAVDLSGERIVTVKSIELDYSIFHVISSGMVLDEIRVLGPHVRLARDKDGWNLGRLVRKQEREADREGPGRPISLQSIAITDGQLAIDDAVGTTGYRLPERIEALNVDATFEYEPVRYTIDLNRINFRATSPELTLEELSGRVSVRDDNVYLDRVVLRTADSGVQVDGVVEQYLRTPVLRLTTTGEVSLPEMGRVFPDAAGYQLHPAFEVSAEGPAERLALDLNVKSDAGNVRGQVTADVRTPDLGLEGELRVERLNLAPILRDPAQRSDVTGEARVDLRVASRPAAAPFIDRLSGSFRFVGPRVLAAGYEATNVRTTGSFAHGRINLDAQASAYGGSATARGFVAPPVKGRPLAFDLQGSANDLDLRNLPAVIGAPQLATDLSVSLYHVHGSGRVIAGSATLNRSVVEGATIAEGTVAEFGRKNGEVSYGGRGAIADLNLQRLGGALGIEALNRPEYDSRINGRFEVSGAGTGIERITLTASGTLDDSTLMGAQLPHLTFDTRLNRGDLAATVNGQFANLNPARVSRQPRLEGAVSGAVDGSVRIADVTEPIAPESIEAAGTITLTDSVVGGLRIESATVDGEYVARTGSIRQLQVTGPDLVVDASGQLALDRTGASDLNYQVEATDLAELGRLAGVEGLSGSVLLDGRLTGNATLLETTGTLDGSNVAYQESNVLELASKYAVAVPELTFADAEVKADTEGTFVKAGGMEINEVAATTTFAGNRLDFTTRLQQRERELQAGGQVIFHPDHQEIHLPDLAVRTQGQEWRLAAGTEGAVQYGGGRISLENIRLESGTQSLDVAGTFALQGDEPVGTVDVTAVDVDVAQLERLLMQDRGMTGTLSADVTVAGTLRKPLINGRVEIVKGGFQTYRYDSLTADVEYGADRIQLDATLQQSSTEAITAKGTIPLSLFQPSEEGHIPPTGGDRVDLHIQSTDLSLAFVQGLTTQVTNVQGTMQADLRVTGSGQDPHVAGFIDIRKGAFGVPLGGVSYSGLDTRITLDEDVVRIQQFSIRDEHDEALTIAGQLAVHARQVGAVDITLDSDNFEVINNELGDVGVDSQLRITGELRRPRVEGQVRLEAARLEVDRILQLFYDPYRVESLPQVVSAERMVEGGGSAQEATREALERARTVGAAEPKAKQPEAVEAEAPTGAFAPVALDVRLAIPDNLVLRGSSLRPGGPTGTSVGDMNITVGGDLRILKNAGGQVRVAGVVTTIRGTYDFQGRRFNLERGGTLRLTGEPEINPLLNITATRQIPDTGVEARIQIGGTVQSPELQLSSTPPLEESDILALIVFNRPVNELGTGERASLAATAGGIATGFLAEPLGKSIGRALDLDVFEITTTTDEGELGAGLTIGQQVGDRLFFRLRQQFGERNISEFLIEYQLARFLRLQASAAPETSGSANRIGQRRVERAGIDLIFFFSY